MSIILFDFAHVS